MLSRPFLIIALSIFTATMGLGMVLPLLPIYAKSFGASAAMIGVTISAFALPQLLFSPFLGRWADRWGRKPFLMGGAAAYLVSAVGWWSADTLLQIIAFRALSGVGAALIFSNAQAYVGDLAPEGSEGRYMGAYGVFDFMGFGLGPLFAGVVRDHWGIETVFLCMAVIYACVFSVITFLLPARPARVGTSTAGTITAPWGTIARHATMQALFVYRACYAVATGVSMAFLAVHLEDDLAATATMIGLVFAAQQFTGGLSQPFLGRVADRFSRPRLVFIGGATMAAGLSTVVWSDSFPLILAGMIAGPGLGAALANVSSQALQINAGRDLGMATVASLGSTAFALGFLVGAIGGGRLVDAASVPASFGVGAAVMVAGGTFFLMRVGGRRGRVAPRRFEALPVEEPAG